jgi:hypothetical protein
MNVEQARAKAAEIAAAAVQFVAHQRRSIATWRQVELTLRLHVLPHWRERGFRGPGKSGPVLCWDITTARGCPMNVQDHRSQRLLRPRDVLELTGMSHSALYRMLQAGDFPQPLHIGEPAS